MGEREVILALLTALNGLFLVMHGGILFFMRRELNRFERHALFNHEINDNFSTLHSRQALVEIYLKLPVGPPPKSLQGGKAGKSDGS